MHLLIAYLVPLPFVSYGITFLLWSVIGVGVLAPVRLANAAYQNARITGKYHFRERYTVRKAQYEKEIRTYVIVIMLLIAMVLGFSALSHRPAVVAFSDTVVWDVIKFIRAVR